MRAGDDEGSRTRKEYICSQWNVAFFGGEENLLRLS